MDFKTLTLVIILSILIGIGIFTADKIINNKPMVGTNSSSQNFLTQSSPSPTPTPKPSLPPITKNSNLLEETQKITIPDFSEEYNSLKAEVNK